MSILSSKNKNIFPIIERVGLVRKLYEDNLEFNEQKEEKVEYEYINITKEEKNKYPIKKKEQKEEKKSDSEILTITKRPSIVEIEKKKKEKLEKIQEEIDEVRKDIPTAQKEKLEKVFKEENIDSQDVKDEVVSEVQEKEIVEASTFVQSFINAPKSYYTSNLAAFDTKEDARNFVSLNKLEEKTILVTSNSTKIMVMYGAFPKREEALAALRRTSK